MLLDCSCLNVFKKIYVGFSGGADSTALLLLLAESAECADFSLEAVHFEHGIRGSESLEDALWCRNFCENRNIPFRRIDLEMGRNTANLEAEARILRLQAWKKIVNPLTDAVALGQHIDDRIENLFLRLMRGSNSTGLTSLRSSQKIDGITFVRPLVNLRRSDIESFLLKAGVDDWRIDRTNNQNIYRRNVLRNKIIPLLNSEFPGSDKALIKSMSALEADAMFLEKSATDIYMKLFCKGDDKPLRSIPLADFAGIDLALRPRILRLWLTDLLGYDVIVTSNFMYRLNRHLEETADRRSLIPLTGGLSLSLEKGTISLYRDEVESVESTLNWYWKEHPEIRWGDFIFTATPVADLAKSKLQERCSDTVYFDLNSFPESLVIRSRKDGDRMRPFGNTSYVKVKKLLQQTGMNLYEKRHLPVLETPTGEIIWLPGVRRSDIANISDESCEKILELKFYNVSSSGSL